MTERQLVVGLSALALLAGVVAIATGAAVAAVAAGSVSVGVACLALRSLGHAPPSDLPGADSFDHLPTSWSLLEDEDVDTSESEEPAVPKRRSTDDVEVELGPFGLFGPGFLDTTLRNRVAVARRALRPLSVVHFEVFDVEGDHAMAVPTNLVAAAIDETLRESDVAGWRNDGVFVFVLEETGEDGAVWTAERLRRRFMTEKGNRRFRAGIAAYPTHGLDADAVDAKAAEALRVARDWNRDRIEVASGI